MDPRKRSASFGFPDGQPPTGPNASTIFPSDSRDPRRDYSVKFLMELDEMSEGKTGFSIAVLDVANSAGIPIQSEEDKGRLTRKVKFLSDLKWITCHPVDIVSITEVGSRVAKALVEFYSCTKK